MEDHIVFTSCEPATLSLPHACVVCRLGKKADALGAIQRSRDAGFRDPDGARRDPEFEKLYPAGTGEGGT